MERPPGGAFRPPECILQWRARDPDGGVRTGRPGKRLPHVGVETHSSPNVSSKDSDGATAPNTPPCIVTILSAAS